MPRIVESRERLEKFKDKMKKVFEEKVVPFMNSREEKNLKIVKYFGKNGILGEKMSNKVLDWIKEEEQKKLDLFMKRTRGEEVKEDTCAVNPFGNKLILMGDG